MYYVIHVNFHVRLININIFISGITFCLQYFCYFMILCGYDSLPCPSYICDFSCRHCWNILAHLNWPCRVWPYFYRGVETPLAENRQTYEFMADGHWTLISMNTDDFRLNKTWSPCFHAETLRVCVLVNYSVNELGRTWVIHPTKRAEASVYWRKMY